jgi:hypothetical protein
MSGRRNMELEAWRNAWSQEPVMQTLEIRTDLQMDCIYKQKQMLHERASNRIRDWPYSYNPN